MIDMNHKYQTRDGRAVRILCVDGQRPFYPVVGYIGNEHSPDSWSTTGEMFVGIDKVLMPSDSLDLVPVPTKHEGFIVVGKDGFVWGQHVRDTPEEAANNGYREGDHIVPVHWED